MTNSPLRLVVPTNQDRTVMMPIRKPNAELRTLEFLTQAEIDKLIDATKWNRRGHRDAT